MMFCDYFQATILLMCNGSCFPVRYRKYFLIAEDLILWHLYFSALSCHFIETYVQWSYCDFKLGLTNAQSLILCIWHYRTLQQIAFIMERKFFSPGEYLYLLAAITIIVKVHSQELCQLRIMSKSDSLGKVQSIMPEFPGLE